MNTNYRSLYLKEMGISEWTLRGDANESSITQALTSKLTPTPITSEYASSQINIEPKVYWLFYGTKPSGEAEQLFKNMIRALSLLPNEWEWREPIDTSPPKNNLPCVAFAFGVSAAQALCGEKEPLENLRDVVLEVAGQEIPLVASYDLAHLLSKPKDKALAWQDLLLARSVLQSL
jgi:DNA polymerase